jgi:hypothetical protein
MTVDRNGNIHDSSGQFAGHVRTGSDASVAPSDPLDGLADQFDVDGAYASIMSNLNDVVQNANSWGDNPRDAVLAAIDDMRSHLDHIRDHVSGTTACQLPANAQGLKVWLATTKPDGTVEYPQPPLSQYLGEQGWTEARILDVEGETFYDDQNYHTSRYVLAVRSDVENAGDALRAAAREYVTDALDPEDFDNSEDMEAQADEDLSNYYGSLSQIDQNVPSDLLAKHGVVFAFQPTSGFEGTTAEDLGFTDSY